VSTLKTDGIIIHTDRKDVEKAGSESHSMTKFSISGADLQGLLTEEFIFSSFLGSTAQLRPWPPPQNPAEFLGGFSTIFFFTG
jgi:hypothetical protein